MESCESFLVRSNRF